MSSPAITFHHVGFAYHDEMVIENAEICLAEGSFLLVLGPNGGGKTTFGKLALGLLQPTYGSVQLFERPPGQMLQQVGYVPQINAATSRFPIDVAEVVRLGLYGTPSSRQTQKQRIADALQHVGLSHLARRPFASLSGGERQRVLIARALVSTPRLLILDEPTANIDILSKQMIYQLLTRLSRDTTILLISHDLDLGTLPITDTVYIKRQMTHVTGNTLSAEMLMRLYGAPVQTSGHEIAGSNVIHKLHVR
jgi:zinc transport system ATP-binding protein